MKIEQIKVGDQVFGFIGQPVTILTRMLRVSSMTMTDRYVTLYLETFGRKRYPRGSDVPFLEVWRGGNDVYLHPAPTSPTEER